MFSRPFLADYLTVHYVRLIVCPFVSPFVPSSITKLVNTVF